MAAWMKSRKTGRWFLTGELFAHRFDTEPLAAQVSDVLGFASSLSDSDAIQKELDRVERNRAQLVKEIADAILPAIATGATVTVPLSEESIAERVRSILGPDFDELLEAVERPRTLS